MTDIARACKYINYAFRASHTDYLETENASGEAQLPIDVEADKIILGELRTSQLCALAISEEQPDPVRMEAPRGTFTVAYDPLDGSSLFGANLSVGSIFGIWGGDELVGQTGDDMLAAMYVVYGPQVRMVCAVRGHGVFELEMNDVGEFIPVRTGIKIAAESKYFAPGNLRCCTENGKYMALIQSYVMAERTLRYSGGMVPDIHHIISKGAGIFLYPEDTKHPTGKLRVAFECQPMALIFEEAGGAALTTKGQRILELAIDTPHQRSPIVIGSKTDVHNAVEALTA